VSDKDPIFDDFPELGFETGEGATKQRCQFVFTRTDAKPNDWTGNDVIVEDKIPGGERTLRQNIGSELLTLTTGLMFRDAEMYHRFRQMRRSAGTLRMNAAWTMWPSRTVQMIDHLYTEFDNVSVRSIDDPTFDLSKSVHCTVVFTRQDDTL